MVAYGGIQEKGEKYYTYLKKIFSSMGDFQKNYRWLITDCTCYPSDPQVEKRLRCGKYCWLSGEELTAIVEREDFQWIWAVLSGFSKEVSLEEVLKYPLPYADGYRGFWKIPLTLQHPLARVELVPWDSSLTLLLGRDKELVDTFRQAFSLSEDLYDYNERLAQR